MSNTVLDTLIREIETQIDSAALSPERVNS